MTTKPKINAGQGYLQTFSLEDGGGRILSDTTGNSLPATFATYGGTTPYADVAAGTNVTYTFRRNGDVETLVSWQTAPGERELVTTPAAAGEAPEEAAEERKPDEVVT
jgi:hypothetical protein